MDYLKSMASKTSPARSTLTPAELSWARTTMDRALLTGEEEIGTLRWSWTLNETIGNAQTWYDLDEDLQDDDMFNNAKRVLKTFLSEPFIWGTMQASFSRNTVKVGPA